MGSVFLLSAAIVSTILQIAAAAAAGEPPPLAVTASPGKPTDVVVTGTRPREEERTETGSRLKKAEPLADFRGFVSQVATSTGVAGMTPQSGMDPFAGPTLNRTVKVCRSSDKRLSRAATCELAKAKVAIEKNDLTAAHLRLDRVLEGSTSNGADRFFAHRFKYEIARRSANSEQQFEALSGMVATGLFSGQDQILALKTLASIAVRAGHYAVATDLLERVVREAPNEAKAHANLGVLYANRGAHDLAKLRLVEAVRLTKQAKLEVPAEWTAYLKN